MKKMAIALSLFLLGVGASGAWAQTNEPGKSPGPATGPGPTMRHSPGMGPQMRWWENPQLNLSAEQKAKLEALFQTFQQEIVPLRNSMFQKRQELEDLLGQAQLDKEKILAKNKELITLQNTMEEKRINLEIAQRLLLTPEQRSLVKSSRPLPRGPRQDK